MIFFNNRINHSVINRENKNRTGCSHSGGKNESRGEKKQTSQPGAPNKSNRQTKGNDESGPVRESGTKKGPNSV